MAILIASLSSGQSWKTHTTIMDGLTNMNSNEVREEYRKAKESRWKTISASDISEVLNKGISNTAFCTWLFFNVDQSEHKLYKEVWTEMNEDFMEACDDLELAEKIPNEVSR